MIKEQLVRGLTPRVERLLLNKSFTLKLFNLIISSHFSILFKLSAIFFDKGLFSFITSSLGIFWTKYLKSYKILLGYAVTIR